MSDTFRAMCAELHTAIQLYTGQNPAAANVPPAELVCRLMDAMAASAALLAQPEPEGLTDEELLELMPQQFRDDLATVSRLAAHGAGPDITPGIFRVSLNTGALDYARAAIAADRWSHPTPQPPAEGEVGEESWYPDFADWLEMEMPEGTVIGDPLWWASKIADRIIAADLLERQHPQPVAVSERPWEREGWCDDEGQCWMGDPGGGEFIPSWRLCPPEDAPRMKVSLPFNALPLPKGNDS